MRIKEELQSLIEHEMEVTEQVAMLLVAGHSGTRIREQLGISQAEFTMARERLERVAKWLMSN